MKTTREAIILKMNEEQLDLEVMLAKLCDFMDKHAGENIGVVKVVRDFHTEIGEKLDEYESDRNKLDNLGDL